MIAFLQVALHLGGAYSQGSITFNSDISSRSSDSFSDRAWKLREKESEKMLEEIQMS